MKVLVFGAGAVGSVLGGLLARSGHDVSLLGRPWHLDTIAKNGLSITGLWNGLGNIETVLSVVPERQYLIGRVIFGAETEPGRVAVVRECYAVGRARGVRLEPAEAQAYLDLLVSTLIPKTAGHFPSMLQDLRRGKPTEIDALNGAISRLGRQSGVPTPANDAVTEAIKARKSLK